MPLRSGTCAAVAELYAPHQCRRTAASASAHVAWGLSVQAVLCLGSFPSGGSAGASSAPPEERPNRQGGALNGAIRPRPRRFETKMAPALLEGRFTGPAFDERLHHRPWPIVGAGRAVGSRLQETCGSPHEPPAAGPHGLANPLPHGGPTRHVQLPAAAVVPAHAYAGPAGLRLLQDRLQWRPALPLHARTPVRATPARRSWLVQGCLQPPRGHQAHVPAGTGAPSRVDTGRLSAAAGHLPLRQPTAHGQPHLAGSVWYRLLTHPSPSTPLWGRGGDPQDGSRPRARRPRGG
jgi:hypothetical protein